MDSPLHFLGPSATNVLLDFVLLRRGCLKFEGAFAWFVQLLLKAK